MLGVALGTILLPLPLRTTPAPTTANTRNRSSLRLTCRFAAPAAPGLLAILAVPLIAIASSTTAYLCHCRRCLPDPPGYLSLTASAYRADPGQGAGARLLRPSERQNAGQDRVNPLVATQAMRTRFTGWFATCRAGPSIGLAACLNAALLYRPAPGTIVHPPQWAGTVFSLFAAGGARRHGRRCGW